VVYWRVFLVVYQIGFFQLSIGILYSIFWCYIDFYCFLVLWCSNNIGRINIYTDICTNCYFVKYSIEYNGS